MASQTEHQYHHQMHAQVVTAHLGEQAHMNAWTLVCIRLISCVTHSAVVHAMHHGSSIISINRRVSSSMPLLSRLVLHLLGSCAWSSTDTMVRLLSNWAIWHSSYGFIIKAPPFACALFQYMGNCKVTACFSCCHTTVCTRFQQCCYGSKLRNHCTAPCCSARFR